MRKTLPLGAVAMSEAEGTELVWRQGYYEPLGGTPARFATAPLCVDALSRARLRSKRVHKR